MENDVKKNIPKSYQILTNLNCNLRCKYCYENKCNKVNNIESIKKYLNALYERDFGNIDVSKITYNIVIDIIGGESFLYPEMLDEICSHAKYLHNKYKLPNTFLLSIATNGTLLTTKPVQDFILKWKDHLSIGLSIDGTKELHDSQRIYPNGNGSYDKAIEGWNWLKSNFCIGMTGCKATYCHDTIKNYADGVINLIKLGFNEIGANVVFEEIWTDDDFYVIYPQLERIADYIIDNDLENKINFHQLNKYGLDMLNYNPYTGGKKENHCGSCVYMTCLGFDNKIYGCNRFCTMKNPIPIGELKDDKIIITNKGLKFTKEIKLQYKQWPEKCKKCGIAEQCPSCSAIPYEVYPNNPSKFFETYPQCGWTKSVVAGRLYFKEKLIKKLEDKGILKFIDNKEFEEKLKNNEIEIIDSNEIKY